MKRMRVDEIKSVLRRRKSDVRDDGASFVLSTSCNDCQKKIDADFCRSPIDTSAIVTSFRRILTARGVIRDIAGAIDARLPETLEVSDEWDPYKGVTVDDTVMNCLRRIMNDGIKDGDCTTRGNRFTVTVTVSTISPDRGEKLYSEIHGDDPDSDSDSDYSEDAYERAIDDEMQEHWIEMRRKRRHCPLPYIRVDVKIDALQ